MTERKEQWNEKVEQTSQTAPRCTIDPAARGAVPNEDLQQFARAILPLIQAFYESDEGKRALEEWKSRKEPKPPQK